MSYLTIYLLIGIAWTCFTIKEEIDMFIKKTEDEPQIVRKLGLLILLIMNVLWWPKEIYDKILGYIK